MIKSLITGVICICLSWTSTAQNIVAAEYFLDTDPGLGQATPLSITSGVDVQSTHSINTSSWSEGVHNLCIRSKDDLGQWSESTCSQILLSSSDLADITEVEYFIGDDPGIGNGLAATISNSPDMTASISFIASGSFDDGLNLLSFRSKNADGEWSHTSTVAILKQEDMSNDLVKGEYFFDTDPGYDNANAINIVNSPGLTANRNINTANLEDGLHRLHFRFKDSDGQWSIDNIAMVSFKDDELSPIVGGEYFFGEDPGYGQATAFNSTIGTDIFLNKGFDVSNVDDGLQCLQVRFKTEDGRWSHDQKMMVLVNKKMAQAISMLEYFFDSDPGIGNGTMLSITQGSEVLTNNTVDVSNLDDGVHQLYMRSKTVDGDWSLTHIRDILVQTYETGPIVSGEYFWDTDPGQGNASPFDLDDAADISEEDVLIMPGDLDPGEHDLYLRTKAQDGTWSHTYVEIDVDIPMPLPVSWTSFDVRKSGETAVLDWTVSSAYNCSHFEVARSTGAEDFDIIGNVACKNTTQSTDYTFVDHTPLIGWNKYKLIQEDLDGGEDHSVIRQIYFNPEIDMMVYPNPTQELIYIQSGSNGTVTYSILSASGMKISSGQISESNKSIDVSHLKAGVYYVHIDTHGTGSKTFKIVKL